MTVTTRSSRLALEGGAPVRPDPMPIRTQFDEREVEAATDVIRRATRDGGGLDRYGGCEVDDYERELAEYFGFAYVTCVSSGTAAIHSALGALDLEPGSEVISSSTLGGGGG